MTTSKGLGISIKYGDHSRKMELRVNQRALGVRVPQGDNLRPALLRKSPSYLRLAAQHLLCSFKNCARKLTANSCPISRRLLPVTGQLGDTSRLSVNH